MNRALIVGINNYPSAPLNGCINDVNDVANFLVGKCGFAMGDVRLLTDERATTAGIKERLGWLMTGLRAGDRVLFHYSGHGVQMPTRNTAGEVDGLDEAICPVDFDWSDERAIRDKEFNKLFATVPDGVEFVWISDSCHSGDLSRDMPKKPHKHRTMNPPVDINWRLQVAKQKKTVRSMTVVRSAVNVNVGLIAACRSDQTAADADFDGKPNGALTYFLLKELQSANGLKEPITAVLKNVATALTQNGYEQQPQVEGNQVIIQRPFLAVK
jgi:hypothetical protein